MVNPARLADADPNKTKSSANPSFCGLNFRTLSERLGDADGDLQKTMANPNPQTINIITSKQNLGRPMAHGHHEERSQGGRSPAPYIEQFEILPDHF